VLAYIQFSIAESFSLLVSLFVLRLNFASSSFLVRVFSQRILPPEPRFSADPVKDSLEEVLFLSVLPIS